MAVEIVPDPTDAERCAILDALARTDAPPPVATSRWRASALDDLRDGAIPEQPGGDPRVVEP